MKLAPFEGSELQVINARRHIRSLEAEFVKCQESFPQNLPDPTWDGKGLWYWDLPVPKQPPVAISSIVMDAVHNLRSALDLLIMDTFTVIERNGKGSHFPFAIDIDELRAKFISNKYKLRKLPEGVLSIIETYEPFHGGRFDLRALHDIDISNKHNALVLVAAPVALRRCELLLGSKMLVFEEGAALLPGNREIAHFFKFVCDEPIQLRGDTRLEMRFVLTGGGLSSKKDILSCLRLWSDLIDEMIARVREFLAEYSRQHHSQTA